MRSDVEIEYSKEFLEIKRNISSTEISSFDNLILLKRKKTRFFRIMYFNVRTGRLIRSNH